MKMGRDARMSATEEPDHRKSRIRREKRVPRVGDSAGDDWLQS